MVFEVAAPNIQCKAQGGWGAGSLLSVLQPNQIGGWGHAYADHASSQDP